MTENKNSEKMEQRDSAKENDSWPDNAPEPVKEYEKLRKNPPKDQKHLYKD